MCLFFVFFFFQAEDGIRDAQESRGLGDVYKRQQKIKYEIGLNDSQDGLLIWCNVEDAVARYTYVLDSVGVWPPEFVTCFALRLAYDIAYPLTQREDAKDTMFKLYQHAINHAIVASKAEGYRQFVFTSDALEARRTS